MTEYERKLLHVLRGPMRRMSGINPLGMELSDDEIRERGLELLVSFMGLEIEAEQAATAKALAIAAAKGESDA